MTLEPQRFGPRDVDTEVGRGIRAKKVEPGPAGKAGRPPPAGGARDIAGVDGESRAKGREIGGDPSAGLPLIEGGSAPRLSPTEIERRISRHAGFIEKLDVDERRAVEEYYRRLRDIR